MNKTELSHNIVMSSYELHFLVVDIFSSLCSLVKITFKFVVVMVIMTSPWIVDYLFETLMK